MYEFVCMCYAFVKKCYARYSKRLLTEMVVHTMCSFKVLLIIPALLEGNDNMFNKVNFRINTILVLCVNFSLVYVSLIVGCVYENN